MCVINEPARSVMYHEEQVVDVEINTSLHCSDSDSVVRNPETRELIE